MAFEAIIIRSADSTDIEKIWDLLHADCKGWSEEQIRRNLSHLFLLTRHDKLLGVLYGEVMSGKVIVVWMVIHPLYAEVQLKQVFIQALQCTQCQTLEKEQTQKIRGMIQCPGG